MPSLPRSAPRISFPPSAARLLALALCLLAFAARADTSDTAPRGSDGQAGGWIAWAAAPAPEAAPPAPLPPPPAPDAPLPPPPAPPLAERAQPVQVAQATPSRAISYEPAAGFRCLFGQSACAFQMRPLAIDWTNVDLHGDIYLGGLTGGGFGLGAGTRHIQLTGDASAIGLLFRWDNELTAVKTKSADLELLTAGINSGPRLGVSYSLARDIAVEAMVSGRLLLGYGMAAGNASNQWVAAGYAGLTIGTQM